MGIRELVFVLFTVGAVCGAWAIKLYLDDVFDGITKPLRDYLGRK
jgi:hypothetical protein